MSDKCCIVTGGSRGIGLATALAIAREGYSIVIAARGEHRLAEARRRIEALGVPCLTVACDIARVPDAERLVRDTLNRFGRIDVLVNNAGDAPLAAVDELATAEYDRVMALNCGAVFHLTRLVWPVMKKLGSGVIINVSSRASVDPFSGFSLYGATKAWVNLFTKAVADEGRRCSIRAFAVAPGAVETELLRSLFKDIPAESCLSPEDVARVIVSCLRPDVTERSGETIFIDAPPR